MVVFTCAHCGDSLHKPKVEKHYDTKCRNKCPDLCCVDCLKDFRGDEFIAHTKCMTESERYGGKGFKPKPGQNKGEKKQSAWIEIVQSAIDDNVGARKSVKILLEKVSKQPNTPRKESKFYNFVKSLDRRASQEDVQQAWEFLKAKLDLVRAPEQNGKVETDGVSSDEKGEQVPEDISSKSETKKRDDAEEPLPVSKKEKKNKRKAMENDSVLEDSRIANAEEDLNESVTKKEKKSKRRRAEDNNDSNKTQDSEIVTKEEKKNKVKTTEVNGVVEDLSKIQDSESVSIKEKKRKLDENGAEAPPITVGLPLSKKEKKEMKKRAKYEAELREIESKTSPELVDDEPESKKEKRKRKREEVAERPVAESSAKEHDGLEEGPASKKPKADFDWIGVITAVLAAKDNEMQLKKLQKRALTEYCSVNGVAEAPERIVKKFFKTLKNLENVRLEGERVIMT